MFIFDGYDELRQIKNLYVTNHLETWQAKIIITCRCEYLYHIDNYALHFMPFVKEKALHSALVERVIKPFSSHQVDEYIKQVVAEGGEKESGQQSYQTAIDKIPGLKQLLSSPLMLKLAMSKLAELLTQTKIYERQQNKLKAAGKLSADEDLKPFFWSYTKALAKAMHAANVKELHFENQESIFDDEINIWKIFCCCWIG